MTAWSDCMVSMFRQALSNSVKKTHKYGGNATKTDNYWQLAMATATWATATAIWTNGWAIQMQQSVELSNEWIKCVHECMECNRKWKNSIQNAMPNIEEMKKNQKNESEFWI